MFIEELTIDYERLKSARGKRKPSEVAATVGISRQSLWNIESGMTVPRGDVLARLCWLYDCPIKEITKQHA